jgi:hypothetical protein
LRYEVGICIQSGKIVWFNGGVPCGEWPDLRLARNAFTAMLDAGERALADKGYNDRNCFIIPIEGEERPDQKAIMARHETVNRRLKQFGILQKVYRHNLRKHPQCFRAVLNLTELMIENGEPLYDIEDVVF